MPLPRWGVLGLQGSLALHLTARQEQVPCMSSVQIRGAAMHYSSVRSNSHVVLSVLRQVLESWFGTLRQHQCAKVRTAGP